jgi:hypothetical protein
MNPPQPGNKQISKVRPFECSGCFPQNFKILINSLSICRTYNESHDDIDMLFIILTVHTHVKQRMTLRQTWLKDTNNNTALARYVFLLGTLDSATLQEQLRQESMQFKDIIQFNFVDSYRNITYKSIMGFKWAVQFCSKVKFIFKTDDDVYINIPNALRIVKANEQVLYSAVGGECLNKSKRDTDPASKWYITPEEYPSDYYPGYCSGYGYVTSMSVAKKIVRVSNNVPFFHLEDVYFGFCIHKLNYTFHTIKGFYKNSALSHTSCNFHHPSFVITFHVDVHTMTRIWRTPCIHTEYMIRWKSVMWIMNVIKYITFSEMIFSI